MSQMEFKVLIAATAILSVTPAVIGQTSAQPKQWCATARPDEPLMKDAIRVGTATDEHSAVYRTILRITQVPRESIAIVSEDSVCRTAASAYAEILRKSVDPTTPDKPVLVIRVDNVYFVDDLRSREGPDPYWEAMVFDARWHRLYGFGAGA